MARSEEVAPMGTASLEQLVEHRCECLGNGVDLC
jgi:hypothetical protein